MTNEHIYNNLELINWLKSHYEEDNLLRRITPTFNNTEERLFDIEHGAILIVYLTEDTQTGLTIYDDDIYITRYDLIPGKDKMKFDQENYTMVQPHFDRLEDAIKTFRDLTGEYLPIYADE